MGFELEGSSGFIYRYISMVKNLFGESRNFRAETLSTWTHSFRQSAAAAFPVSFSGSSQRTEGCQAKLLAAVV